MNITTGLRIARVHHHTLPSYGRASPSSSSYSTILKAAGTSAPRRPPSRRTPSPPYRMPPPTPLTRRPYSSSSSSPSPSHSSSPSQAATTPDIKPAHETTHAPQTPSERLNPPASTRPPPLDVPTRAHSQPLPRYLLAKFRAYKTFYTSGLKAILANRRLLRDEFDPAPPSHLPASVEPRTFATRAAVLLRRRTSHDLWRLPVFGLVVLICGEFTPVAVLLFPRLAPYTCRIPRQVDKVRRAREDRRAASYRALRHVDLHDARARARVAPGHVSRVLGLTSRVWDRVGLDGPFARTKAARAVREIVEDDERIWAERGHGGVELLEDDEVVLACEARGMNVRGMDVAELRQRLGRWVETTMAGRAANKERGEREEEEGNKNEEAEERVVRLLLGLDR
ncbi:hypothetical protein F4778DRAFT_682952 [Xylariomycetidae sp. FL2044]|nr:hypothetical protein F4778DRAFT_682952 [Xylariomycetidae sp. FL2044]